MIRVMFILLVGFVSTSTANAACDRSGAGHCSQTFCEQNGYYPGEAPEAAPAVADAAGAARPQSAPQQREARVRVASVTRRASASPYDTLSEGEGAFVVAAERVPWSGGYVDPLVAMLDTASEQEVMTCVVNLPYVSSDHIRVHNASSQPGRITIDGVDVRVYDMRDQPQTAIIHGSSGERRYSVLMPGQSCYVMPPYRAPASVKRYGYAVVFHQAKLRGPKGVFLQLEYSTLYTARLYEGSSRMFREHPGTQMAYARFGPNEGVY